MAYVGLVPSEHSSGDSVRRGSITKAGNSQARRALIEGAWTYRMQARVSRKLHDRLEDLSQGIRDMEWRRKCVCARGIAVWCQRQAEGRRYSFYRTRDDRVYLGDRLSGAVAALGER
jgi:transposase